MNDIIVAFDIDGTLIKNANASIFKRYRAQGEAYPFDAANLDILELLVLFAQLPHVKIVVWSGGGIDYAWRWVQRLKIEKWVWRVASKTERDIKPDIAFDDVKDFNLGKVNVIVQ